MKIKVVLVKPFENEMEFEKDYNLFYQGYRNRHTKKLSESSALIIISELNKFNKKYKETRITKFGCRSCGNIISFIQLDKNITHMPFFCICKRNRDGKNGFKPIEEISYKRKK